MNLPSHFSQNQREVLQVSVQVPGSVLIQAEKHAGELIVTVLYRLPATSLFYRLDEWFSSQEAPGQLGLDGRQVVTAVCLPAFLQSVATVRQNERQQLSLRVAQGQLGL